MIIAHVRLMVKKKKKKKKEWKTEAGIGRPEAPVLEFFTRHWNAITGKTGSFLR